MNGTKRTTLAIILAATGLIFSGTARPVLAQSTVMDIEVLEASIKAPDTAEARAAIREQTAALQKSSSRVLSREGALDSSTRIYLSHNRSLLQEMFYHLEQIVPYSNFEDRHLLQKLQSLKANKDRFDRGQMDEERLKILAARVDAVYEDDLDQARNYLADKATRLYEICEVLSRNMDSVERNLDASQTSVMPQALTRRITEMRTNQAWYDFTTPTATGKQMRQALARAQGADTEQIERLTSCIASVFDPYREARSGVIIDKDVVKDIFDDQPKLNEQSN